MQQPSKALVELFASGGAVLGHGSACHREREYDVVDVDARPDEARGSCLVDERLEGGWGAGGEFGEPRDLRPCEYAGEAAVALIRSFAPDALRDSTRPLLDWLETTGCSRAALHFDVDAVDSNEIVLGLAIEPHGLTGAEVRRIVADIDRATDVVGSTIAEFVPRQVMHLQGTLDGIPLLPGRARVVTGWCPAEWCRP